MTHTPPPTGRGRLDDERTPFDELFAEQQASGQVPQTPQTPPAAQGAARGEQPRTRREAPEQADRPGQENPFAWHDAADVGGAGADDGQPERPKRKRRGLRALIVTVVIVAMFGGAGAFVWNTFQPQVQKLISMTQPTDYTGNGTGSVTISIKDGDTGSDVATTLHKAAVTKTYDAFYKLLLATNPTFQPGVYSLKKHMSAKAALAALQDPKNKLTRTVAIPEGTAEKSILAAVAKATQLPLADLQKAAATPSAYGLPPQAKTLEGFLFPATYTFDPGVKPHDVIKTMVDRTFQALDDAGVPADKRWNTIILASVVQKEAGPNQSDFGKIARVFQNRLDKGWPLQSDATVAYGTGKTNTVFTTQAQRDDASNPYNTYAHTGLPAGPIGNPGDVAIKAALHPTPGPWLYFVAVNLKTGETEFSTTAQQHDAAVKKLQEWCAASKANDAYCN